MGVLFGGRSGEHEVSLLSAASVLKAIDKKKYDVVPIGITKEGRWVTAAHAERLLKGQSFGPHPPRPLRAGDPETTSAAAVLAKGEGVVVPPIPGENHSALVPFETASSELHAAHSSIDVDIIFPVLHGTFGEDGTIQGLLELADIPYVGAGVLGSAAGMDKDVMKRLFRDAGIPIVKHITVLRSAWRDGTEESSATGREGAALSRVRETRKPGLVGRYQQGPRRQRIGRRDGRGRALRPQADRRAGRVGGSKGKAREIECSVLGNDNPIASVPGEVVPIKEFYDYNAKYLDKGSESDHPGRPAA